MLYASPELNKQYSSLKINTAYYQSLKEKIDRQTILSKGFSFGLSLAYKFNRFEILTAFEYVKQTDKDSSHYNYFYNTEIRYSENIYQYYAIPLLLKYHILREKFKLYSLVGADYRFLLGLETTNATYRKHHLYLRFGVGTSIPITEKFSVQIEPNVSLSTNNIYIKHPNNGIEYYPYSFGLKTGIAWHF